MRRNSILMLSSASAAALALSAGLVDAKPVRHRAAAKADASQTAVLKSEVEALRAQVSALTARLDAQQAAPPAAPRAAEAPTSETMASPQADTQSRIEDLETQLSDLQQAQAVQTAQRPAIVTLPNGRPTLATADGRFGINFHGVGQFDAGAYFQDKSKLPNPPFDQHTRDLNSGTNVRRFRLGFDGKLFGDFEYSFLTEFGGSGAEDAAHIHELWGQYSGMPPWHLKVGYFEPLIGLNANISTNSIPFLERASPAEVSRNVAAGDTRAAAQFWGNDDFNFGFGPQAPGQIAKSHWLASVAVTGNTGSTVNSTGGFAVQPFDEQLSYIGRLAIAPYGPDWTLHLGVHGQFVDRLNDTTGTENLATPAIPLAGRYTFTLQDRPELRLDTTRLVSTGALNAAHVEEYGLEAGGQWRNFFAQGEYFLYDIEKNRAIANTLSPHFTGWYAEGTWLITGESRTYAPANGAFSNVVPLNNFDPNAGHWGAFEVGVRYSDLDLNSREGVRGLATPVGGIRGGEQKIFTASVDWYLNPTIRFILQGQDTRIERLNGAGLNLGQEFQTLEVRSQVAF